MTTFRLDPRISECATIREVADSIGIVDQAFYDLRNRWPDDFPRPVRRFGNTDVYLRSDLELFHYEHGYNYGPGSPRAGRRGMLKR